LGNCQAQSGKPVEAEEWFAKALRVNNSDPQLLYEAGTIYIAHNKVPQGIKYLNAALDREPRAYFAALNIGVAYLQMKDTENAIAYLNRAGAIDPTHPEGYINLATALSDAGDGVNAQKNLEYGARLALIKQYRGSR